MEFKDYYEVLGVPPEADTKTIKAAYRKLARQYHPDVNPGNREAEEKFKVVNEAYQALSNPDQRKKYDQLRAQYLRWQQAGRGQPGGRPQQDFNWQEWTAQPGEGVTVEYTTIDDLNDLFGGQNPFSDFFTSIFGQAAPGPARQGPARQSPAGQDRGRGVGRGQAQRGQDVEVQADVTLEEAFHGTTRQAQLGDRRIEVRIPPGVRTGSRIRLSGQGEPGRNGGPTGDMYIVTRLLPHPSFELDGNDLHTEVPVDIYTAVLGGEVRVPTLDRPVMLKIPPRTQAGRSFRIRGKGMPTLGQPNTRGDLFARVRLVLPDAMTEEEISAFRELAARRSRQPA